MRFGVFISPIHDPNENPTLSFERDLQLIEDLDKLGYDEVWMGEHHSTGWEIVGSPEVFLAAAAERTNRIMLGSGVVSLPNHNPFHALTRMILLDHISRGRAIFGMGPGALPADSVAFGIEPGKSRNFLLEGARVVQRLLAGESVTEQAEWFKLDDARLQIFPYKARQLELAVTAAISASGPRTAGQLGASMLSLAATQGPGTELLSKHWEIYTEEAEQAGHTVDRSTWRLLSPMFIAPTREKAREAASLGVDRWTHYMTNLSTLPFAIKQSDSTRYKLDQMVETGFAVIGTPEDAIDQIKRLEGASGGFGTYMIWANEWASPADTHRSYELFAREVMPVFQGQLDGLQRAEKRALASKEHDMKVTAEIKQQATDDYEASKKAQANQA